MANNGSNMHGSQFFITLGENLTYLDDVHTVFGEVSEGLEVLQKLNETIVDDTNRPYQDIRLVTLKFSVFFQTVKSLILDFIVISGSI